jgi:glutamate-ammonia-ligase adenylyltransferase
MSDEPVSAIKAFIRALPDPQGAQSFWERLESIRPVDPDRDALLLSRLLTIAAYSPFLAEILLRHPEHIDWLRREADRVKTTEQLSEELARFVTGVIDADDRTRLARFKRRELLRIYLRDCLAIAGLTEVTEELSNLADVILSHALALAHREMTNLHGAPLTRDERGRIKNAELAIVALGKLGCRELNYASDIDLLFLYSGEGETAGRDQRPESVISNKEFFKAIAERVVRLIGSDAGEGAVYRIDLRLRPYGRDGELVWEIERAADYYSNKAQNWERQALIRARASAGSYRVVAQFLDLVRDSIFARDARARTLEDVRRAKEKIDRTQAMRAGGFNVKLGRGGIREIEFIAQALQLQHGGREPWVRTAHTLIVLARLAEKNHLTESERARLSAAYAFLRTLEHRLQMEHGAQTHTLPVGRERLNLVARRSGYLHKDDPAARLLADLEAHTSSVRAIYNRVFAEAGEPQAAPAGEGRNVEREVDDETGRLVKHAAAALSKLAGACDGPEVSKQSMPALSERDAEQVIVAGLPSAINPLRSLRNLTSWAESLATCAHDQVRPAGLYEQSWDWRELIKRLLATLGSQYLSHILVSRPALASALGGTLKSEEGYFDAMRAATGKEHGPAAKMDALRRTWYRLVISIGYEDMIGIAEREPCAGESEDFKSETSNFSPPTPGTRNSAPDFLLPAPDLRVNNLAQTALAEAALRLAVEIAFESLGVKADEPRAAGDDPSQAAGFAFTILGLGRLGHAGMDYGSDLDLLVVFDDAAAWPPPDVKGGALEGFHSPQEFYAKLTSEAVRALSSITREGLLYRVDLRLRPEGKNGPLAQGLSGLLAYLASRASAWEHSAYLKAREVVGDAGFGSRVRAAICEACFDAASRNESLKEELANMRARLESEKARKGRPNIKWGRGGMTDVYFVTRYLQLRDRVSFPTGQGTAALIAHLGGRGSLDAESARRLFEGYSFLRRLDHWMRLLLDRPTPVLPASNVALRDLARALRLSSAEEFERLLAAQMSAIRAVYDKVFE